ncbi:MAG: isochorismatase family protein [Actinomycetota bacterium]
MPALRELVAPAQCAVLTMECQRGIIGDLSAFTDLVAAARDGGVLSNGPRVIDAARAAGVRVVHCTAERRADGAGSVDNCRMLAGAAALHDAGGGIEEGTAGAELVPAFGPDPADIVMPRLNGLTPFTGTSLDQVVRNLGVTTVVAVGVSLNIGVLGLALSAVDLGYQVVVVADAVAGVPLDYGRRILDGTVSLLATVVETDELLAAWD